MLRAALAVVLAGLWLAVVVPAQAAGFGGVDRSFGDAGTVDLTYEPEPSRASVPKAMAVAPDGKIYVLSSVFYGCTPTGCSITNYLVRYRPDGSRDWTYGGDGTADLPSSEQRLALTVDAQGRPLVAMYESADLRLLRLRANGAPDLSFGKKDGAIQLPCGCTHATVTLKRDPNGYMFILQSSSVASAPANAPSESEGVLAVRRLGERGRLNRSFGLEGEARIAVSNSSEPGTMSRLPGGGLAFAAGTFASGGLYVGKLRPDGSFERRFLEKTRRELIAWAAREGRKYGVEPVGLLPRRGGEIDVIVSAQGDGYVLRLRADGSLDRRFGADGVKALPWSPRITIAGPGGRVFTVGEERGRAKMVVGWLDRKGNPVRSFAGGTGAVVGRAVEPASASLAMQRGRPVLLEPGFFGCRSKYCPPQPFLMRFTRWAPG